MELNELLKYFRERDTIGENQEAVDLMRYYSRQAQKITMEINTKYHEPEELQMLFSELIGKPVDKGFGLFPPFYTDFGKILRSVRMYLSMPDVNSRIRGEYS